MRKYRHIYVLCTCSNFVLLEGPDFHLQQNSLFVQKPAVQHCKHRAAAQVGRCVILWHLLW
jgi:uncharacterized protein YheU (UPF0270 family)